MDIEKIIEELEYYNGYFPKEALEQAIKQKEAIIPELLKILESSVENISMIKNSGEFVEYWGYIYAMFLLAQFREEKAFPLILQFFTILNNDNYWFSGDIITEDLQRLLASVFNGDVQSLINTFTDVTLNEYVRLSAMETIAVLTKYGDIDRDFTFFIFKGFLKNEKIKKDMYLITETVIYCAILDFTDLREEIKTLYDNELIDIYELPFKDTENIFEKKDQYNEISNFQNGYHYSKIDDVIATMQGWVSFKDTRYNDEEDFGDFDLFDDEYIDYENKNETYIRTEPKIGRNDPCPCGSGKKYKKCCGV